MARAVRTVLISGAGIAGLSLALRLHQRGLVPIVIERAPALRDGGYMLALSDPGYDAADRLGIFAALRAAEYLPERMVALDGDGREKFAFAGRAATSSASSISACTTPSTSGSARRWTRSNSTRTAFARGWTTAPWSRAM